MLWRVRTTLADRPGALAELAARCGGAHVNILGLQIFLDVEGVTDELVLSTPEDWDQADIAELVVSAGGREVNVSTCTAHALVDGPTNYLLAVRHVVDDPALAREALTELLDGSMAPEDHSLDVTVGDATVTVHRAASFTVTEQARAHAFAAVVTEVLASSAPTAVRLPSTNEEPVFRLATAGDTLALVRMAARCSAQTLAGFGVPLGGLSPRVAQLMLTEGPALVVQVGHEVVGLATLTDGDEVCLLVEDGAQGRGFGSRLLGLSARLAKARGSHEIVLRSHADSDAVPRLSAAAGLTGRLRYDKGSVVLTAPLRRVAPLLQYVEGPVGPLPLDPAPA
jgi:GNAT superfamily N-acetyltransferase